MPTPNPERDPTPGQRPKPPRNTGTYVPAPTNPPITDTGGPNRGSAANPKNVYAEPRDIVPRAPPHSTGVPGPAKPFSWQDYFRSRFGNLAPLPGYDTSAQDEARRLQQQVIQDLQRQAAGDMNSRAQQSLYAQNNAAQGQQRSLASTQRGVGAGAQMQQAQTRAPPAACCG